MNKDSKRREALLYHAKPTPGKIQVVPTKEICNTKRFVFGLFSWGAEPCWKSLKI
jgi:malate dehydrogenase (oxaloacetate-decarboxylating)(NADP+)